MFKFIKIVSILLFAVFCTAEAQIFVHTKDSTGIDSPTSLSQGVFRHGVWKEGDYVAATGNDTIYFSSEQPATLNQVSITFRTKTTNDTIWIDWGEDTPVWISGTTDQIKTSDYSTGSATYSVKIYGDVDKITKFRVNETYVTFSDMANNIGKMTGLTDLYLRNCTGITTASGNMFPSGLTALYLNSLPNFTYNMTGLSFPSELTSLTLNSLPNFTATSLSIPAFSKEVTVWLMSTMTLPTVRVDELLLSMDTFYAGANLMTQNAAITLNGTGVGAPTGGALNTNIVSLTGKATSQNKTWTFLINTP